MARSLVANTQVIGAWLAIGLAATSLVLLIVLHMLSPEFDPSFRMVSEYAYGHYGWVLSLMFLAGGLNSWALAAALWDQVTTRRGKAGLWLLLLAGLGSSMASVFDITQSVGHGIAGFLGVGCLPVAALLITGSLSRIPAWSSAKRPLRWLAHFTWISIILLVVSMVIMTAQFAQVYGELPDKAPAMLPDGVFGLTGWADRLILLAGYVWATATAWWAIKIARSKKADI